MALEKQMTETNCCDLYNYELCPDTSILQSNQTPTQEAESLPVPREEVEEAVLNLRAGKSPGVDNIPSELLDNGGEIAPTVLTVKCQKIWETKEWTKEWTQSLIILFAIPARSCSRLSSTNSRPRLRNCWQKTKQVLDQAGAQ